MMKGKTLSRVLAWMLTIAMVMPIAPAVVVAEENPQTSVCTHIHDLNCGYVEAVAEVPCDNECIDMDGDGVIDHVEDCAYTPAVEGLPCNHVHDENCGGLTENQSEETQPKQTQPEETEQELSNELLTLKARIDTLPTGEEYRAMTSDEQDSVYGEAAEIADVCLTLTEEELAEIGYDRLEALFMVMNEEVQLYDNTEPVTFKNSGYPYGKDMTPESITLVIEINGTAASYQWQKADSKKGTFEDISGAAQSTYTFKPDTGKWYRCMVDGTASEAVMAVEPYQDGRIWTRPHSSWYLSNGTMAYMANGEEFDAMGLYTKENTDYMLCTSCEGTWYMFSSNSSTPSPGDCYSGRASLDTLRVSFSESDAYALIFEADLAEGQQAFSFGCDTQLGNGDTSGNYGDMAALMATVKNGRLQQVAMIGAETVSGAKETDPAFVISPVDSASRFWIGCPPRERRTYAYNTGKGDAYETIDNEKVVTLLEGDDSGMTMSWMNIPSGGSVKFQFSVGNVAHTGAVGGKVDCKVDYEKDALTGLKAGTTYVITAGESKYTITANASGEIPLAGMDNGGNAYDFAGKTLNIAKQGSDDTPAEIDVAGRPETPDDNIEIVELTTTSVTLAPKVGQQYAYSTDGGTNWIPLEDADENGCYVISDLTEGATIKIRTRLSATSTAPASQWSDAKDVKLKSTVKVSVIGWSGTYDKEAHSISINVTEPAEGAAITYSSAADGVYSETNPTFVAAGTYTVYYCVTAPGYDPAYGSEIVRIDPKEVALVWSNTELTYNGSEQAPVATVKADSLYDGDSCKVTVSGGQTDYSASAYTATAIGLNNPNYKLKGTATVNFHICPKKLTAAMVSAKTAYPYTGNDITPDVTVKDGEHTLSKGTEYMLSGNTSAIDVKNDYMVTVTGTGNYTGSVDVTYKITDSQAPTGTIKVSTNEWKELVNSLSFGIFYKECQNVIITAADEGSGVDSVSYFITSRQEDMDNAKLSALPDSKWTKIKNGGSFTINPDNKYVIYAKITDKSGNVTYISSNGMILDKTAPVITGIQNNKTYCGDVTFTVADAIGLKSVTIDGANAVVSPNGSCLIAKTNEQTSHTIVAEDKAGNKTTCTITINASGNHDFGAWIETKAATCTDKGIKSSTCSACGLVKTEEISELGHNYKADEDKDAHIVWTPITSEGVVTGYTAKAYFICKNNCGHAYEVNCEVKRTVEQEASTTQEGKIEYTATVHYNDKDFSASRTSTQAKLTKLTDSGADSNSGIYTSASVAETAPKTTIGSELNAALAKDLLTPAEIANYNDKNVATDVTVYLEVQNINGAVSSEEAGKVEAQIADLVTEAVNTAADVEVETGTAYVDLSMYKNVKTEVKTDSEVISESNTTTQITDTGKEITIMMEVPEDIPTVTSGYTRTYRVIRVHDGIAEVLPTSHVGNKLTFKTSKFSTYAVSYVDVKDTSVTPPYGGESNGGAGSGLGASSTTEKYTIPIKNENTVKVEAEISNGKAAVSGITQETINKVVNTTDKESKVDTITIDLSGAKQEVTGVTFSKKSVETLAKAAAEKDNGIETATIELSKATVVLDSKTLETLVDQAKGSQIELVVADTEQKKLNTAQQTALDQYQVAMTFEAYFISNGERIHDFNGGTAVVSIKFTPETGRDSSFYHLVYVADDGKLTRYKTKYQNGKLMFTTTHFSDYAVIYDTNEKNESEEPPKEEEPKEEEPKEEASNGKITLDTTYHKLRLRVSTATKTTNVLKWEKVSDADGYVIYGNKCNTKGKTYKVVKQAVVKDGNTTTWTDRKLAGGTYYKYFIKAYKLVDGKKVYLAKSKVVHSTTTGGKYSNAKSVKVNKAAVSLAVGKNFTIKAELVVKDKPIKKHEGIKFESSNSKVASVTSKGVIKAKKKGNCYIYVYAQNGVYKKIKVTVK